MMKCHSKCCIKVFGLIVLIIAIIIAIIACSALGDHYQGTLLTIAKFFDVIIPILGTGALIKYLFSGHCHCSKCLGTDRDNHCSTTTTTNM